MSTPTDPVAIRALAHPIRLDLLEHLALAGPATAAQCGRALGVSQASCSFHLRQLAKYGFVEEAGPGTDRRERRWQTAVRRVSLAARDIDPAARQQVNRVAVQREADRILAYLERVDDEAEDWRSALGGAGTTLALTVDEAAELKRRWRELVAPFEERIAAGGFPPPDGHRHVRYFMAATPLPTHTDQGAQDHESAG
jgi:DNA-binding transcriptional ArsR family regulator